MNIILGVTGSVAATLVPKLYGQLKEQGHEVRIVATAPALFFLPKRDAMGRMEAACGKSGVLRLPLFTDDHEWPEHGYVKTDPVQHIAFRDWADVLMIAPLSANTLGKIAYGLADNFLTCIARAWIKERPLILAPAMNTEMWLDPATEKHLSDIGERFHNMKVAWPVSKMLACGQEGIGAMADLGCIIGMLPDDSRSPEPSIMSSASPG